MKTPFKKLCAALVLSITLIAASALAGDIGVGKSGAATPGDIGVGRTGDIGVGRTGDIGVGINLSTPGDIGVGR